MPTKAQNFPPQPGKRSRTPMPKADPAKPDAAAGSAPAQFEEDGFEPDLMPLKNVAIFRAGNYGEKGIYSAEDVAELAATYDREWLEAPVTRDHVQEGEAWGWINNLRAGGDTLFADLDLQPWTYYAMREGLYKRFSVEIYRGVKKGERKVQYIRAVSILGAASPHVKGLPPVQFGDAPEHDTIAHIDFSDNVTDEYANKLSDEGTQPAANPNNKNKETNAMDAEKFAEMQAKFRQEREEYDAKLKDAESKIQQFGETINTLTNKLTRTNESARFNDVAAAKQLDGSLPKADRDVLEAIFHALPDEDNAAEHVQFGEVKMSLRAALLNYINGLKAVVDVSGKPHAEPAAAFNAKPSANAPHDPKAMSGADRGAWLNNRAMELQKDRPDAAFADLLIEAQGELNNK